jgi:hypothetical protein
MVGTDFLATNIFDTGTAHFIKAGAVEVAELITARSARIAVRWRLSQGGMRTMRATTSKIWTIAVSRILFSARSLPPELVDGGTRLAPCGGGTRLPASARQTPQSIGASRAGEG